jgi:A/G-specific adenine glycosylase
VTPRVVLLRWYRRHRRDLPWRRTRDPYAIWISEAMLQQTQVETVIPYYERFLRRFPDVRTLAAAELEDVLREWAGLGYYSRARNLHAAAGEVVERFAGRLPADVDALRSLPGVGRYTAGAVASIAFDRPAPVLDGNVTRVLVRLHGIREEVGRPAVMRRLWDQAAVLARGPDPGDLNQALMELGARVCTPRAPRCEACPLEAGCVARRAGDAERLPRREPRRPPRPVRALAALVLRRGQALAVRRPRTGLLAGLWELPGAELADREVPGRVLRRRLAATTGLRLETPEALGRVTHRFTHRSLELFVFRARAGPGRVRLAGYDTHRWLAPDRLRDLPQGRATRKALELALGDGAGSS